MVLDAIVIGAGLSGLSAAYELSKAGKSIVVLEARNRVGGRTYTRDTLTGGRCDVGGAWINEFTQPNITKLAKEAGIPLVEQSIRGIAAIERTEGSVTHYDDHGTFQLESEMPEEARQDEKRVVKLLDELTATVDVKEPWNCERAEEFDSMSFLGWLNSVGAHPLTKLSMTTFIRCLLAVELNDVSFLYLLHYFVTGGGYQSLASNDKRGGQFQRMREGSMRVSEYITTKLSPGSLKLSSPVQRIFQDENTGICEVTTRSGEVYTSKVAIISIPSPLYPTIQWSPMLPIDKRNLMQRSYLGNCSKIVLLYRDGWWRRAGYSGLAASMTGPICQVMDTSDGIYNSADPALIPRQYSLSCFPMGQLAINWSKLGSDERVSSVKAHVARLFPGHDAEVYDTVEVFEQQWMNEEFSMGAPCPVLGCGALMSVGKGWNEKRFGNVFFAGTENADVWKGYMDGAVSAGKDAAEMAIKALASGLETKLATNGITNGVH